MKNKIEPNAQINSAKVAKPLYETFKIYCYLLATYYRYYIKDYCSKSTIRISLLSEGGWQAPYPAFMLSIWVLSKNHLEVLNKYKLEKYRK